MNGKSLFLHFNCSTHLLGADVTSHAATSEVIELKNNSEEDLDALDPKTHHH